MLIHWYYSFIKANAQIIIILLHLLKSKLTSVRRTLQNDENLSQ